MDTMAGINVDGADTWPDISRYRILAPASDGDGYQVSGLAPVISTGAADHTCWATSNYLP